MPVSGKADTLWFEYDGRRWCYDIPGNRLSCNGRAANPVRKEKRYWSETDDEKGGGAVVSPDGKYVAYIKDSNLYVRERSQGDERAVEYRRYAGKLLFVSHSVVARFPENRGVPHTSRGRETVYLLCGVVARESVAARLHRQEYAKPGDELPYKEPRIFEVESGRVLCPLDRTVFQPHTRCRDCVGTATAAHSRLSITSGAIRSIACWNFRL